MCILPMDNQSTMVYNVGTTKERPSTGTTRPGGYESRKENNMINDYEASAAALYDGGWRAEDREQLIYEYDLTAEEADKICELLAAYDHKEE